MTWTNVQLMLEQSLTQLVSSVLTFGGSIVMMTILSPLLFAFTALVLGFMIFMSGRIGGKSRAYFKSSRLSSASSTGT